MVIVVEADEEAGEEAVEEVLHERKPFTESKVRLKENGKFLFYTSKTNILVNSKY